jgi:tRNA A-37 threonylcarbamoyl transferase component Bud32
VASTMIGRTLGNYKIVELLGHGGMATVYTGYQETVDRRVAIKVLPPHPGLDAQFIERFQLEARTIAHLQHPHILPLYDYGTQDEIMYLVMAYIEGGTLEDRLRQGKPMPLTEVEQILRQVAGALDYAHRQGIVHRDIKPANILIDGEGHALLADFGIAKLVEGGSQLTGTGVVGTPAFMSPEQAQGAKVDSRADIYSLGVVVYQMITGQQPFAADTPMQVMLKVINQPVPDVLSVVEGLPEGLSHVMKRVLAKDPDDRYQTAAAFAEAVSQVIHATSASLAAARAATPIESRTEKFPVADEPATEAYTQPRAGTTPPGAQPGLDTGTGPQTVIINQMNPLVLLGGVAIIAVALVVVVLLVTGNLRSGTDDPDPTLPAAVVDDAEDEEDAPVDEVDDENGETVAQVPDPAVARHGRLTYSTNNEIGDSLSLRVEGLERPGTGSVYVAWLVNTDDDSALNLGTLVVDAQGDGALSFTDTDGRTLPAHYNAVGISREERGFTGDQPEGEIVYSGSVPIEVSRALYEIFVSSEDGLNDGSLLSGAITEATFAAQHAGLASGSTNIGGIQLHTEHAINILRGETVDYNGNGRGENPGRGVGVYPFLDRIESRLTEATSATGATISIQTNAEFIRVCLDNTRVRADQVVELGMTFFEADDFDEVLDDAAESSEVAEQIRTGYDLNQNGIIEPFEGECGLDQIEEYGVLFGSKDLVAGGWED